jgi:hypothetical protein
MSNWKNSLNRVLYTPVNAIKSTVFKPYVKVTIASKTSAVVRQYNAGTATLQGPPTVSGIVLGPFTQVIWQNALESHTLANPTSKETLYAINNTVTGLTVSSTS